MPFEVNSKLILNESHIKDIFNKIEEIIQKFQDKLVIIVFEEYFFSQNIPMTINQFNFISNACKQFTSIYHNCLLFVNLLHAVNINNIDIVKQNIKTYSNTIGSKKENKIF